MARKKEQPEDAVNTEPVAASAPTGKEYEVCYEHGLNLRAEPSMQSEVLRVMPYGFRVLEDPEREAPDGWLAVSGGGYCRLEYLK